MTTSAMATAVKKPTLEEIIQALPKDYIFVKSLGKGSFGKVVKCLKRKTGEEVAIKMLYSNVDYDTEAQIVEKMKEARLDRANMVKFLEPIETQIGKGLVFECLDTTFCRYMKKVFPLPLCDVRAAIKQMAVALVALETFGYVHTDIKPDNIMVRGTGRPLEFKLIDFGVAIPLTETKDWMSVSIIMFRAPEVLLGCPYDAAIDVWSLGVTVACMLMHIELFPNDGEYKAIRAIVKLLGQPPDELLNQGDQTSQFFNKRGQTWKLKTNKQYAKENCVHLFRGHITERYPSLKSLLKKDTIIREDMEELDSCIDLLEKMLDVNKATRIKAADIGNHPFIKNYRDNIPVEESTQPAQQTSQEQEQEESKLPSEWSITPYSSEEFQAFLPERYTVVSKQGVDDFCDQMVKCKRMDTGKVVSMKISHIGRDTFKETYLLKIMMKKGLEKRNIAQYFETIDFGTSKALVLEELDTSLADYIHSQRKISIMEARTITQQAATALAALQELELIHADLTMDSIWFTDVRRNHTKIKLVDFSSAVYSRDVQEGMILPSHHRAPEIILGLPITEAVDVWSLGCISVTMVLGFSIFPEGDFESLKVMVALFGLPPDDILNAGTKVTNFFMKTADSWRLMTNKEYTKTHGLVPHDTGPHYTEKFQSLKHLIKKKVNGGMCGNLYHGDYVDLLSQMFQVDTTKRIKPSQILEHWFFKEDSSDSEESEDEEETGEPWLPPLVKAVQSEDTPRVPCITELSRVEHELVAPETVQVFPDRIDNTLLILSPTNDLTLEERNPLGHTVPHFHRFQPYGSGLLGEEMGTSASRSGGSKSQSASRSAESTSQSASRSGGPKSQSASRSAESTSQSASRSGGSRSLSASSSGGFTSHSASRSAESKSHSASRSGGSKSQFAARSAESTSQSASRSGGSKSLSASSSGGSTSHSVSRSAESKSHSASRSGGSKSQFAARSAESTSQSASRSGGSKSLSASSSGGSTSHSVSRSAESKSQSAARSAESTSHSASRSGGSKSQFAARSAESTSQSASRSGGSKSLSASSSGGSTSHSVSRSAESKSHSASRSGGSKSQSAARSGKLEDGNSDGNDHRVPLKILLMVKKEPEEKKKEGKKGEKKKKKKNCLKRVWSWVKKRFSCWNAMDDDDNDRDNWRYVES